MKNTHLQVMLNHFSIIKIDVSNYEKNGEYSFNDFCSGEKEYYPLFVENIKINYLNELIGIMELNNWREMSHNYLNVVNILLTDCLQFNNKLISCMKNSLERVDCINFVMITNNKQLTCCLRNFIVDKLIVNVSAINYIMNFIRKLDYVNLIDFESKGIPPDIAGVFNAQKMKCRVSHIHFIAIFRALYDCRVFNFDYYNSNDERSVAENLYDNYIVKNSKGDILSKETFVQYFKNSSSFQKSKDFKRFYKMIYSFVKNITD